MTRRRSAKSEEERPQDWYVRYVLPVLMAVWCCAFGGMGMYQAGKGTIEIARGLRTMSWQEGDARVLEVKLVEEKVRRKKRTRLMHVPHVRYQFEILGKFYEGNTIHFEYDARSPVEMHKSLYATLQATNFVRVFYNERHPEQNVLCRGVDPQSIANVCIGIFLLLFVSLVLLAFGSACIPGWGYSNGIVIKRRGDHIHDAHN